MIRLDHARRAAALGLFVSPLLACSGGDTSPGAPGDVDASIPDSGNGGHDAATTDAAPPGDDGGQPDAGPPTMRLVGRFDRSQAAGPRFGWPGSAVYTRFEGTSIAMKLADTGADVFGVVIDGAAQVKVPVTTGTSTYPLATGLAGGAHTLVLTKITESTVGTAQLLGFALDDGKSLLATPEPSARRLEVLGDSISCGYGVDGADQTCKFSPGTENVARTYIALTAASLSAEYVDVAYSGKGIYRDAAGSTTAPMPALWTETIANEASSPWSFPSAPDVLVVLLGANDFVKGDPGQPFVDAYRAFLAAARAKYPATTIVCTLSPMLSDAYPAGQNQRTTAAGYLRDQIVKAANDAGDAKVLYFEFDEQQSSDGYGCDYHPSATTHQKMATKLTAALKTAMGW